MEPRTLGECAERERRLPPGTDERFAGYGVFGVAFESGDVLALRRFPTSSLDAAGYSAVWRRDPRGSWSITTDGDAALGCPRYFGSQLDAAPRAPIAIRWTGPRAFTVSIEG